MDLNHDADADGISDNIDNCPALANPTQINSDSDLQGNECDLDDDNDLVLDGIDQFDNNSAEWADFDFDGIGDQQDPDDDNDGIPDSQDPTPTLPTELLTKKYLDQIQNCVGIQSETPKLLCYGEFFDTLVKAKESTKTALELALSLSQMGALDDCHFVSHEIGHAAFEEYKDVAASLSGIDSSLCRGGFYHGVIAAYFHSIKEQGKPFPDSFGTICDGMIGTVDYLSCLHGLGHGLMHYFESDIDTVITKCNELSYFPGYHCLTGAFMQHAENELIRAKSPEEVIPKICLKDKFESYDYILCNMQLGTAITFHTNHDYEKGKSMCIMLQDAQAINYCLEGLDSEIKTANKELVDPLTRVDRPIIQPFWINDDPKWVVSIVTKSLVSDFNYEDGVIEFEINHPASILIFAHQNLIDDSSKVTLDGNDVIWKSIPLRNHDYSAIQFDVDTTGLIRIYKN